MISESTKQWILERKTGCILYTSPSFSVREAALKSMSQISICENSIKSLSCDCSHCYNIKADNHPHISIIKDEDFEDKMRILYSYPTPIVQIQEIHKISLNKQTKLLIWLESIGRQRFVMMGADTEYSVLPTIRSRSIVFTEIPKFYLSQEDEFRARMFVQNIFSGKEKFDSIVIQEEATKVAYNLRQLIVNELQSRMMKPAKKLLPGSDVDLITLMKVIERYLEDPKNHNLRTLLMGFMMIPIQGMK